MKVEIRNPVKSKTESGLSLVAKERRSMRLPTKNGKARTAGSKLNKGLIGRVGNQAQKSRLTHVVMNIKAGAMLCVAKVQDINAANTAASVRAASVPATLCPDVANM
eukprot:CAMPEP_0184293486 /NCGR_PEP_ID=MMETSP1049-20130417/4905_1 /TAXON_ID=77928 /ORGANISM="Proteomonas sulcata, Strain CCMP704" /LENGTH=106 /DNA_ID=CAMNT_0026601473 /DNA_START=192 /DNA_END=512 /DNA_ORIENTATION=+